MRVKIARSRGLSMISENLLTSSSLKCLGSGRASRRA
jgi:hypothetical protein